MKRVIFGISILAFASCGNEKPVVEEENNTDVSLFQWDFSKERKFIYSFSQTVSSENKMKKEDAAEKSYMIGEGQLNVRVKENNLADVSLTDLEMQLIMFSQEGKPEDTMTQKVPSIVAQDMNSNGGFADQNVELMFDLLFPLPNKAIDIGDSAKILLQIPFNANGSRLFSQGGNTIVFKGYEEVDGHNCAVLEGIIDISKLDIPEELKGEFKSVTMGNATYYFDLENGYFIGADIKMIMEVLMDFDGEEGFDMYMSMESDNVFKIRLEKIEE